MSVLPWLLLVLFVGVGAAYFLLRPKEYLGEGKLDAQGRPYGDRAPPADVNSDDELSKAIGAVVGAGFQFASNYWKSNNTTKAAS